MNIMVKLEPKTPNGGEYHVVEFDIDEYRNLGLSVSTSCYGSHHADFAVLLPLATADDVERLGMGLIGLAKEMRKPELKLVTD